MEKVAVFIASGSGMGADAAKHLSKKGFKIGIMSNSGNGEKLAKSLNGVGYTGSNKSTNDLREFINKVFSTFGRIDVIVNSAGHGPKGKILEISDQDWINGMEVYFLNIVRTLRLVTPIMQKQNGGSIINISTFATFEPDSNFPTSGVFRSGLASYTKLYADEYAKNNIRINNILPGFIDSLPEQEHFKQRIPLNRYGKVSEISAVVELLASDGGAYITGQNIRVDGGITRSV